MAAPFAKIQLDAQAMDCCFHPSELLLTVGLIDGTLETYALRHLNGGDDEAFATAESGWSSDLHSDSCRCVAYLAGGEGVLSASKDGSLVVSDVRTGEETFRADDAHDGVELSRIFCASDAVLASGDDDGNVKLWDPRQKKETAEYSEQEDYISSFALHRRDHCLVSTSGDGTVAVFDLKKGKLRARSEEDADDEYLSCQVMKKGKKVVVGTQQGVVSLFSWGYFNDCSDRFPGHPNSIDALVKYDEDTILTGAGDGAIRILSVLPNKLLGVLGVHQEDEPVERMAMSCDSLLLASAAHDAVVKIWSLRCLQEEDDAAEDDAGDSGEDEQEDKPADKKRKHDKGLPASTTKKTKMKGKSKEGPGSSTFFADLL